MNWFDRGLPVNDPRAVSGDFESIIDDEFYEEVAVEHPQWRLCVVPREAFEAISASAENYLRTFPSLRQDEDKHSLRLENIRQWMRAAGGVKEALISEPIILTLRGSQIKIEDGTHRLALALFESDLSAIPALCLEVPNDVQTCTNHPERQKPK